MILYLHGFTSGPQSHKAQALGARMRERGLGDRFLSPQLPASPREAIALATGLIARHGVTTVVGSSLGGYYATYLAETFDLKAVLVNPAVVAHLSLQKYIGPQRWLYTGEAFDFGPEQIDELRAIEVPVLSKPERFWLLVEEGDETLDYRNAVSRYAGARQTVLPGGDHSFTRWGDYLDPIIEFAGLT
ncbi:MAG: YqiA/YcfP family alpha/beta fold hydrolase [Sulfuritalea sp.]